MFSVRVSCSLQINHSHTHVSKGIAGLKSYHLALFLSPCFSGMWLQYSTSAGPTLKRVRKDVNIFVNHCGLPYPIKESHTLDLGPIFPNATKVVSCHLTEIIPRVVVPNHEGGTCSPHQAVLVSRKQYSQFPL